MPDSSAPTLYYVLDPMCSWCWGFRPVWLQIQQQLPAQLRLVTRVGGLAPDSDVPMQDSMRLGLQDTWRRIQQKIPGTQFNFDFWTLNTPRRSTYPACRAVIAARQMAGLDDLMTYGIQQAYYLQARNPSNLDTLVDIAAGIGLDAAEFEDKMRGDALNEALTHELAQVRALGIHSFPSLLLEQGQRRQTVALDYNSAAAMLREVHRFLEQGSH